MTPHALDQTMSFGDHLEELRKRLFLSLLGPIPIMIVCLVFGGAILEFLMVPVETQLKNAELPSRLQATSPTEPFSAYLKVGLVISLLAAGPWILYQAWLFVAPGLYPHERRFVYFLVPLSAALTVAGTVFLYKVLLPVSLRFLILFGASLAQADPGVATIDNVPNLPAVVVLDGDPRSPSAGAYWFNSNLQEFRVAVADRDGAVRVLGMPMTGGGAIAQQYRISEYVNLVFLLGIVFAVAFQLPVVLLLLGWADVVEPSSLTGHRKMVLFGCAIAGAILTPADPISMVLLALPLYLLFEFGILLMRVVPARKIAGSIDSEEDGSRG